ncbi:inositol 5-phosphatase [Plasmodium gonderi]|uniref:Inositol 5-phosphatase n=1 Tax=Plasmodium gonderi TaxID=77519 RepID=A0A1Y1J921_PLAGO|nr:inositol 5-phosphatase [Plasmodium gonderi]GAW79009.1 inositol 5-phosphatase [Plasmodium gonderi]
MYGGKLRALRKVKVYGSQDSIFIVGLNKKEESYEITELARSKEIEIKQHFEVHKKITYRNFIRKKGLEYVCKCEGILGCIKFLNYPYLYAITKKEKVALLFNEHQVYNVKSILLIPFRDDVYDNFNNENELVQIFYNSVNHKYMYFSYTYNLPCCVQENFYIQKELLKGNEVHGANCKNVYIWNYYHCKPFIRKNIFICVLVINGFLTQSKFSCMGNWVDVTFIARRSIKYAGTRYRKRGVNAKGYSANEVETEIILFKKNYDSAILSYVQLRGSVPILWNQSVTFQILKRPKIKCVKNDIDFTCTKRHFQHLLKRYGYPITVINLLSQKKHSDENNLSKEYETCIKIINKNIPPPIRIIYKHLDLRKAYKIGTKYTLQNLKLLFLFSQNKVGYFYLLNNKVLMIQRGIFRFNCVDCLDRTNAAQLFMNMYMFVHFLKLINQMKNNSFCVNHISHLSHMYEHLGDAISKQYAGSTAHKKYTPGQGTNFFVQSKELLTSLKRYYISSFNDLEKQKSINLFLGVMDDKLDDIQDAHDLDTYVHGCIFFKSPRADSYHYWWVLPLERFYRKVELLLGRRGEGGDRSRRSDRSDRSRRSERSDRSRRSERSDRSRRSERSDRIGLEGLGFRTHFGRGEGGAPWNGWTRSKGFVKRGRKTWKTRNEKKMKKKKKRKQDIPSLHQNLKFYHRCFSRNNVFKNIYNAHNLHNCFIAGSLGIAGNNPQDGNMPKEGRNPVPTVRRELTTRNTVFRVHNKMQNDIVQEKVQVKMKKWDMHVLSPFERSFNHIGYVCKFYNVYKNDFSTHFKNQNIFRFRAWRLIATYNYLNYVKIFFDFFFLFYYCFCIHYSVNMVYMQHINVLSEKFGGVENGKERRIQMGEPNGQSETNKLSESNELSSTVEENNLYEFFPLINIHTSEKDVQSVIRHFEHYKKMPFSLEPYLVYDNLNKHPYQYMLMNLRSTWSRGKKSGRCNPLVKERLSRWICRRGERQGMIEKSKNVEIGGETNEGLEENLPPMCTKRHMNQIRERVMNGKGASPYYGRSYKRPQKRDCEKRKKRKKQVDALGNQINKMPRVYCPLYFNVNIIKFFLFIYNNYCDNGITHERIDLDMCPKSMIKVKEMVIDMCRKHTQECNNLEVMSFAPRSALYNMKLFIDQAIRSQSLEGFLSDLYMNYIYKIHEYKELNIESIANSYISVCSNAKKNIKKKKKKAKGKKYLLDEYGEDSFEYNLKKKKKKKKILLIDKKIKNEINKNYKNMSTTYSSIKHFEKYYFDKMSEFQKKDKQIKTFFFDRTNIVRTDMVNHRYYNKYLMETPLHYVNFNQDTNMSKLYSPHLSDFNIFHHTIESNVDYQQYCDPLSHQIFRH